jgi:hypothetical protein
MKIILQNIQESLATIAELKYVDENWGQMDDYSPNPPTQFPLALIDVGNLQYTDIGRNRDANPEMRQMGSGTITIKIANLKLVNSSARAPQAMKNLSYSIWDLIESVHANLHGKVIGGAAGAMMRTSLRKVTRDDGIQMFELTYSVGVTNV